MKIDLVDVKKIKPYANNPRRNEKAVDKVAKSLSEFGFQQPIVVDKKFVVIAGHTRLLAALKLGVARVPVLIARDLSETKIRAYRLADNRTAQEAEWDENLLKLELEGLQGLDFDLSLTGFDSKELYDLLNPNLFGAGKTDENSEYDLPKNPVSKSGDIFLLGPHRLMCGDATNPQHVEKLCNKITPVLMATDPPYGVGYDPNWRNEKVKTNKCGQRTKGKLQNDERLDWSEAYSLFTGSVVYIWHAAKYVHALAKNLEDLGFNLVTHIVWAKHHHVLSRGDYHSKHESCWYAVRKNCKHNWQGARDQMSLWEINSLHPFGNQNAEKKYGHSTQKPVECMARPIANNTQVNDYVYDPFGGSGTTMIACEKLTRGCLMLEIDPKYCDVIVRRWQEFTDQKAILESNGKQFDKLKSSKGN